MTVDSEVRQRNPLSVAPLAAKADQVPIARRPPSPEVSRQTVAWNDLPPWQRDNHYILKHYRPASASYQASIHSLLTLHNESVNVWTHLLGSVFSLLYATYFYTSLSSRYPFATTGDVVTFACFFWGAAVCLGCSAAFHLLSNHSERVQKVGNQLDYVGIVALIWGSFVPSLWFGFEEREGLRWVYWAMITIIGAGCATVSVDSGFRTPEWRPFRAGMFAAMGLSAVFPVMHGIKLYGVTQLQEQMGLSWMLLQGVLYLVGAALYAARFPERLRPGTFDIFGSSHQIFHVLILLAAASHLIGLIKAFDYSHGLR